MGLLSAIILVLLSTVDGLRDQFSMRYSIASQLIRNYLPGLMAVAPQQPLEEPLGRRVVTAAPSRLAWRYTSTTSPS